MTAARATPSTDDLAAVADIMAGSGVGDMPGPDAPMGVARDLLAGECRLGYDGPWTLRHHRGDWQRWDGPHWSPVEPAEVSSWLYQCLEHAKYTRHGPNGAEQRAWHPNRTKIAHVADAAAGIVYLPGSVEPPEWIGQGPAPAGPLISHAGGLLSVADRSEHPHTPDLFNQVSLPFAYDPEAPEPVAWLRFLRSVWPDDPEAIAALRQWFGYVVSGRTELHKILLLVGPPRSGKGTIASTLQALVGRGNAVGPTLASLGTNFGLAPLIGKPLAVIGDARLGGRTDTAPVVERLLSISGEDPLTVDRKHREAWHGRLPTRFVIQSNELPRLGDASGAVASRFLTLTLQQSWRGREDTRLAPRIRAELPGILRWALDGLDELDARGAFTEPQSSLDAVSVLQDLTSPVSAFVRECCETSPDAEEPTHDVWAAWRAWATESNQPVGSQQTLGRNLRAAVPGLSQHRPRVAGRPVRTYLGLRLTAEARSRITSRITPAGFMSHDATVGTGGRS